MTVDSPPGDRVSGIQMYCAYMEDIKSRINLLKKVAIVGHSPLKKESWDSEVIFLFLRKCVEQLAFSWLVANKEAYAAAHADFATHWKISKLLKRIESLNDDFYPKPFSFPAQPDANGTRHLQEMSEGFLTRDELEKLYDLCSDGLHTWNPYRPGAWQLDIGRTFDDWIKRLEQLLAVHYIRLLDGNVWLVQLTYPGTGRVEAAIAAPATLSNPSGTSGSDLANLKDPLSFGQAPGGGR